MALFAQTSKASIRALEIYAKRASASTKPSRALTSESTPFKILLDDNSRMLAHRDGGGQPRKR